MAAAVCVSYIPTWWDNIKYCRNCNVEESSHTLEPVTKYYAAQKRSYKLPNPATPSADSSSSIGFSSHVDSLSNAVTTVPGIHIADPLPAIVNWNPVWKVGMVVEGRDGNSLFDCEIVNVNYEDESCNVRWLCDSTVTNRLPYCALYLKDWLVVQQCSMSSDTSQIMIPTCIVTKKDTAARRGPTVR